MLRVRQMAMVHGEAGPAPMDSGGAEQVAHRDVATCVAGAVPRHDVGVMLEARLFVQVNAGRAFRVGEQVERLGTDLHGAFDHGSQKELADLQAARGLPHAHLGQLEAAFARFLQRASADNT